MKVLVATRSKGKMPEIRRILGGVPGLIVVSLEEAGLQPEPAEEDLEAHDTFEENAVSKARYFFERSGIATLADDSGIIVDALRGAPGVRSKRFAPEAAGTGTDVAGEPADDPVPELEGRDLDDANNRHLMAILDGVPVERRTARYVCVAALVEDDGEPLIIRAEAPGIILEEPRGEGGFGYDPYVLDPELGKTFAEMTPAEKDARSHRGYAFRMLADRLRTGR